MKRSRDDDHFKKKDLQLFFGHNKKLFLLIT